MKWELKLYASFGFLIILLLFLQTQYFRTENKSYSDVNPINSFSHLMLDIECNVFLIKGEDQHILLEGPGSRIKNIITTNNRGCIVVRENGKGWISRLMSLIKSEKEKVNIYITLNNLNNIKIETRDKQPEVKYSAEDIIGLTLRYGNILTLEMKESQNCV
jgi:hypothetical protein